jgi:intracellular sulfur oxidation DsrE/DsrF family protein
VNDTPAPIERRGFVSRLAAAAAAVVAAGIPSRAGSQSAAKTAAPPESGTKRSPVLHEQDRWLDALTGMHRQVYDIVTPAGTVGIAFARNFLTANAEGYGLTDADSSVVVSFRHSAVYYAFGDAMWEKFKFGESVQQEGTQAKNPPTRNPELALITSLQSRGVVCTVCGMALRRRAREAAQRAGTPPEAMLDQWRAGLIPGVVEVAAGVIAVNRAQERGFTYVYAG